MIAFAVGMSLCCVWHEDIKKWIRIFDLNENPGQRILRTDIFVFSILIIISLYFGLIITKEIPREFARRHILKEQLLKLPPSNTREQLNENGGKILVKFEKEMLPAIHSASFDLAIQQSYYPISYYWKWLDTKTLYIRVTEKLTKDVKYFNIKFNDLKYLSGKEYG